MAPFLPWPLHLSLLTLTALIAAAYVQPDSAVVAEASALEGAPLASYNYAPAAEAPQAQQSQAAYSGWADQYRHRQRRNALRSRRRRMDNPRYYQPNAEYGSDAQVAWENYRLRSHEKRDLPAEIQRHDNYQGYAAPMEADSSAARYKSNDNRRDVQAEQAYAGQGYDDRSAYKRYQKQRRAAVPEPAAVPSQKRRSNWAAWPSDYGEPQEPQEAPQQPWNGRYPQYEYGDDRGQREEATAAAQQPNYANDVAGQDGGVEQAGDNELAYQKK